MYIQDLIYFQISTEQGGILAMVSTTELQIPNTDKILKPGYQVRLGRFNDTLWTVGFGWYAVNGNRPICGWYLSSPSGVVKSLQSTDLSDIYVIQVYCPPVVEDTETEEEEEEDTWDAMI